MDDKLLSSYSNALRQLQESGSLGAEGVEHDPYTTNEMETTVIGLLVDGQLVTQAKPGDKVEVILLATPFYVESGGQVADTGMIARLPQEAAKGDGAPLWAIAISDTRRPVPGLIVHMGEVHSGRPHGRALLGAVDADRRWDIIAITRPAPAAFTVAPSVGACSRRVARRPRSPAL
jgi:alanyl-tRNA synthetase